MTIELTVYTAEAHAEEYRYNECSSLELYRTFKETVLEAKSLEDLHPSRSKWLLDQCV